MWSATTFDCVMVEDVLAFTGTARNGGGRGTPLVQGPQSHAMRKVQSCIRSLFERYRSKIKIFRLI